VSERNWLARFTAVALIWLGGVEWLFGRVISRMAASPALEGVGRTLIEIIGRAGLFLISTAFLLAITLYMIEVLDFGARANRRGIRRDLALAIYLALYGVLLAAHAALTAFANLGDHEWLDITFNLLALVALGAAGLRGVIQSTVPPPAKLGILVIVLAYGTWYYSVIGGQVASARGGSLSGTGGGLLLGEAAAILVPPLFFAATSVADGRWRKPRSWIVPVLAVALFSAGNIADIAVDQGFTGVFTIWSVGFTLFLPWPLYAVSLGLFLHSLGTCFARRPAASARAYASPDTGFGLLLLLYAGLYLQLTYQHLLALLAVLLLGRLVRPLQSEADSVRASQSAVAPSRATAEQAERPGPTT
jgi:hypothetical protein